MRIWGAKNTHFRWSLLWIKGPFVAVVPSRNISGTQLSDNYIHKEPSSCTPRPRYCKTETIGRFMSKVESWIKMPVWIRTLLPRPGGSCWQHIPSDVLASHTDQNNYWRPSQAHNLRHCFLTLQLDIHVTYKTNLMGKMQLFNNKEGTSKLMFWSQDIIFWVVWVFSQKKRARKLEDVCQHSE